MARGFATGLFHGALAGAVGLGALSLLLPVPDVGGDALVPDAAVIATPAGSEFGRGEDAQPLLPAPLTRPAPAPLGGAGAVDAPLDGADAPLADASTMTADRPETRAEDPLAPPEIAPVTVDAEIPAAPTSDSRTSPAAPERFESPAPDIEPLSMVVPDPQDRNDDQSAVAMPPSIADLPVVRPGLPEPPAAESPADMSALTRGRPEDGLGAAQPAVDDAPPPAESPEEPAVDADDSVPPVATGDAAVTTAETEAQTAVEEVQDQPAPDQPATAPEPTQEAGLTAEVAPTDVVAGQTEDTSQTQSDPTGPEPQASAPETAAVEPLILIDSPARQPAATESRADPGVRDYPAINLSTPPDIGGLLAGQ